MEKDVIKQKIKEIMLKYPKSSDKHINFMSLSEIAQLRLGKIKYGEQYINSSTKITFIDKFSNEFKMLPSKVKSGQWSPYESGNVYNNPEYHMKQLQEIVSAKGGKIKEGEVYLDAKSKITFIDQLGNEFQMIPDAVKRGAWSPYESGKVYNNSEYHMKQLQEIVSAKGGKIKEGEVFIDTKSKMTFIDSLGNEFQMIPNALKRGQWSPYESGNVYNNPEYHMKQLQEIVSAKGGKIKEGEVYLDAKSKITFIDQLGNEFKKTPDAVKSGSWSPYEKNCSEHICRQIIEQIYNNQFPSVWNIIKRKNGNKLQLDGYSEKLKIAFEYQGEQHTTGWFFGNNDDKNKQNLMESKERDNEKKQICIDKNILLLEINYYKNVKNISDIINQTIEDIKISYNKNNLNIPDFITNFNIEQIKIDFSKISNLIVMQKQLEEIVSAKGGKIKEGEMYLNTTTKMTFIDKLGNEFKMTPGSVKSGYWSRHERHESEKSCNNRNYQMKQLQKIVSAKGGEIKEGEVYFNTKTKMIFIDKLDNEFQMTPDLIKRGNWSPYESGNVRNDSEYHMKQLQKIVSAKSGKIKEGEMYFNTKTKMIFIDQLGNEFKMTPSAVKSGYWSPYESKKKQKQTNLIR